MLTSKRIVGMLVAGVLFGTSHTAWAVCGDAIRDMNETCDDGNQISMDGCSDTCTVEQGYTCDPLSFMLTSTEQSAGTPVGSWSTPSTYEAVQSANNAASVYNTNLPADFGEIIFNMRVDPGSSDDDFIGWTIGLDSGEMLPTGTAGDRDYLLFNWKRGTQGTRTPGLWFNRVTGPATGGNAADTDLWSSTGNVAKISGAAHRGTTGWQNGLWYQVRMRYSVSALRVWVTPANAAGDNPVFNFDPVNHLEFDETGSFPAGTLGFYSHSQDRAHYELISVDGPRGADVCVDNTDGDDLGDRYDADSDNDGIPDLVEMSGFVFDPDSDQDLDGVPGWQDPDEIPSGCTSAGSPAVCTTLPAAFDVDNDGVPNHLDRDSDGDGVTDAHEAGLIDADRDGIPDLCVAIDVDGLCVAGGLSGSAPDSDSDSTPDFLDVDDDGDGVNTVDEDVDGDGNPINDDTNMTGAPDYLDPCDPDSDALVCPSGDPDDDGTPNATDPDPLDPCNPNANALACSTGDTDGDGITNGDEATLGTQPDNADSDGDGVCDGTIAVMGVCVAGENAAGGQNTDGDMLIDALDPDDDGDGISTVDEDLNNDGDPTNDDSDGDGTPNYLDLNDNDGPLGDLDGDGITNGDEATLGTLADNADSDADGVCDGVIAVMGVCVAGEDAAGGQNTDGDMLIDALDADDDGDGILTTAEDINMDGDPTNDDSDGDLIPDYLDFNDNDGPLGDTDGDGIINSVETTLGTQPDNADSDGDGVCDGAIAVAGVCVAGENAAGGQNTDGDALIDALDSDDDGDGVLTTAEDANMDGDPTNDDVNASGTPDYLDPCTPDSDALVCPTGDPDDDGEPNSTDPDPTDPCDPDPNNVNCDSGDADGDGLSNSQEATLGTSPDNADSDGDGVCDGTIAVMNTCVAGEDAASGLDTDNNMVINALDPDDDGDGISTLDEDLNNDGDPNNDDTDGDMIPDYLDADDNDGPNGDLDGDGVSNEDEDLDGDGDYDNDDTDGDGTPNYLDDDDDNDGILTRDEDIDGDGDPTNDNSDEALGDDVPNYLDPDDDGDGVNTADEDVDGDGDPTNDDTNADGVPNFLDPCDPDDTSVACEEGDTDGDSIINKDDPSPLDPCDPDPNALACPTGDTDMDGLTNEQERMLGTNPSEADSDGDGLDDLFELGDDINAPVDSDMDGTIDALDEDDDNDGILTTFELGDASPATLQDTDANGVPDYLDNDDDGDSVLTIDENADPNGDGNPDDAVDTGDDGTPDYLDPTTPGMMADLAITSPADGSTVASEFQVSGTTSPDTEVEIFVDGESVGTTTSDANGDWTFDITGQMAGDITIEAKVGEDSDSVTVTVDDALAPLEVAVTSPADGDDVIAGDITVSGTATPDAEVELFVDGESVGTTTADENGDWTFDVAVDEGEHDLRAEVTDGDRSETTDTINFTAKAADEVDDEFADYVLSGGCQQAPAQQVPGSWLMAIMAMLGSFFFRRKRD